MYRAIEGSVPRRLFLACFCRSLSTFIHRSQHWREATGVGGAGAAPIQASSQTQAALIGLDGEPCSAAVTLGRFLALFVVGVIAAIGLQQAWIWWLLAAAAVWVLLRLVRS